MSTEKFLQMLGKINLSPENSGKVMQALARCRILKVANQETLMDANTLCDRAFFVLKGGFVCRYINDELEIKKTINFFLADFHPFMGCVDSFFSGGITQCELRAIAHSEVIEFHKSDIDAIVFQDLQLFQFYHSVVTTALQEENDFKIKIIAYSSERLYQFLITQYPIVIRQVPSKYIAEFMGISSEWLSKLKHRI